MSQQWISETYLLRGASAADLDQVQAICETVRFDPGQKIVAEGDKSQDLMIVVSGRARVETREGDLIDEIKEGAVLGEIAFLDGHQRTANVFSVGETTVIRIPSESLKGIMAKSTQLENVVLRNAALALCQRLRDANQQIEGLLIPR
jgi:CRP-like cAMP-binding protein